MALKRKITKVEFDALPADVQKEYKAEGMDYIIDLDGDPNDPAPELRRALDRERQAAKDAAELAKKSVEDLAALKKQLEDDGTLTAKKKGDIEALEKSWKQKLTDAETAGKAVADKLRGALTRRLVDGTAEDIAKRISTSPNVLLPHIKARLQADFEGDEPVTRVLGADGKVSALTLAELEKEFVANADFSAIITGSNASGGGASGGKQGGGGATKKLADMTGAERVAFQKSDPAGFKRESEALSASQKTVKL